MDSIKKKLKRKLPPWLLETYEAGKLIPRFLRAEIRERKEGMRPVSFYTDRETVDRIVGQRMSLSRFGDGEFQCMLGESQIHFQDCSEPLAQALIDTQ